MNGLEISEPLLIDPHTSLGITICAHAEAYLMYKWLCSAHFNWGIFTRVCVCGMDLFLGLSPIIK